MRSDRLTGRVYDLAVLRQFRRTIFVLEISVDELRILSIGNKTDLLRLLLVGGVEIRIACNIADLAFQHLAERKVRTRKLVLSQLPKKIALIFPMILSARQAIAIRCFVVFDAGIMSGRDFVTVQRDRHSIKRRKFQTRIARDTRDRRFARQVALDEWLDNIAFKIFFEIQDIEREP